MATKSGTRISNAVSASVVSTSTSGTLYTCPANSYAVLNVSGRINTGGTNQSIEVLVAGQIMFSMTALSGTSDISSSNGLSTIQGGATGFPAVQAATLYVGPGQSVTFAKTGSTASSIRITGVEFINS